MYVFSQMIFCGEFMKLRLSDIATVQVGYSFRSRLDSSISGNLAVIQMKDLSDNNVVNCEELIHVEMDSIKDHHLVQKGDLIFRSRGLVTNSAILADDPGRAIVAAPLLRIRIIEPEKVLPEYLNWYISQNAAQSYLAGMAGGTAQKIVNKRALENLEVAVPTSQRQSAIVDLVQLAAREQLLLREIMTKRDQYVSALIMKTLEENKT